MNEAFKKQLLTSRDYFQAARWEGKPWKYKLKYAIANNPELTVAAFVFTFICPVFCAYKYFSYEGSRRDAIKKYRSSYIVVRDDHPNIENIKQEKEFGREFFPKY